MLRFYLSLSYSFIFLYIFVLGLYIVLTLVYLSIFIFLAQSFYHITYLLSWYYINITSLSQLQQYNYIHSIKLAELHGKYIRKASVRN